MIRRAPNLRAAANSGAAVANNVAALDDNRAAYAFSARYNRAGWRFAIVKLLNRTWITHRVRLALLDISGWRWLGRTKNTGQNGCATLARSVRAEVG